MCWWGIAFAYGPNINAPMGPEGSCGRGVGGGAGGEAAGAAREPGRSVEYIEAIQVRYVAGSPR